MKDYAEKKQGVFNKTSRKTRAFFKATTEAVKNPETRKEFAGAAVRQVRDILVIGALYKVGDVIHKKMKGDSKAGNEEAAWMYRKFANMVKDYEIELDDEDE